MTQGKLCLLVKMPLHDLLALADLLVELVVVT